jgi:hypothetical protein
VLDGQATAKASDEQQAENGRYLAQMCSVRDLLLSYVGLSAYLPMQWLDSFVKYSTSNHEQMTVTLEQLLAWLQANSPQGAFITEDPQLTNPARGLGVGVPAESAESATLAQGMNQLITTVQTSLGMDAQARDTLCKCMPEKEEAWWLMLQLQITPCFSSSPSGKGETRQRCSKHWLQVKCRCSTPSDSALTEYQSFRRRSKAKGCGSWTL